MKFSSGESASPPPLDAVERTVRERIATRDLRERSNADFVGYHVVRKPVPPLREWVSTPHQHSVKPPQRHQLAPDVGKGRPEALGFVLLRKTYEPSGLSALLEHASSRCPVPRSSETLSGCIAATTCT